jgi:hypothetical protein
MPHSCGWRFGTQAMCAVCWQSDFPELVRHCLEDKVPGAPLAKLLLPQKDDYFVANKAALQQMELHLRATLKVSTQIRLRRHDTAGQGA